MMLEYKRDRQSLYVDKRIWDFNKIIIHKTFILVANK